MANGDILNDVLTLPQVAASLGISESAVRAAVAQERLPSLTLLGRRVVKRDDVEAYRGRTQSAGKPRPGRPRGTTQPLAKPQAEDTGADS